MKVSDQVSAIITSWVDEYSDQLLSWAFSKTGKRELAEDLVQDTFLAALNGYPNFKEESNPKTWLLAILNNKISEYFRKLYKQASLSVADIDTVSRTFDSSGGWMEHEKPHDWSLDDFNLLDNYEFRLVMEGCLNELPDSWSIAIRAKYLENKKGELICQELNITPSNLWQILHRARLMLRKCIEIHWFD